MQLAHFQDADRNIRAAREVAYNYLYKAIQMRNPAYNGEKQEPQNLADTMRHVFSLSPLSPEMEALLERLTAVREDILPKSYDPERERQETADMDRQAAEAARRERFMEIFTAMVLLADASKPVLDEEMVSERLLPLLKDAPEFIAQQLMPGVSQDEISARENLTHVDKVTRRIKAGLYPKLADPEAAEYTPSDYSHTKKILRYIDEHCRVAELALNNFLMAVQKVNDAASGKGLRL